MGSVVQTSSLSTDCCTAMAAVAVLDVCRALIDCSSASCLSVQSTLIALTCGR